MQKIKLNKFIIISVAFHVILISAVLLYFLKNPLSGGKSGTVMVGIINSEGDVQQKSSAQAKASKSKPNKQISEPKIALEKTPIKDNIKNQKNAKPKTQEIAKNETKSTNKAKKLTTSEASTKNNRKTGTESASIGQNSNISNQSPGTQESISTLAYPNYNLNPKPKYPRAARKRGYEGEVKLKVFVLADGRVGEIEVIRPSGHQILDESALEAVKDWVFIPGREDGEEISSWVTVPITFQLKSS